MNFGVVLALLFINLLNSGVVEGQETVQRFSTASNPTYNMLNAMKYVCRNIPISNHHVKMCQQVLHLAGGPFYKEGGLTMRCMCIKSGLAKSRS